MGSVPDDSMLSDGRVRMCGELGMEVSLMGRGNGGQRTRRRAGAEVLTAALFGQPAFEAARTDGEGGEHLGAWHPAPPLPAPVPEGQANNHSCQRVSHKIMIYAHRCRCAISRAFSLRLHARA